MRVATRLTTAVAAAVKSKVALAIVMTIVAVGALGAGTAAAAASGAFGQQVKAKVESCKDSLAKGTHGIGECVSAFAQQHGAQQRSQHSQSQQHGQSQQHNQGQAASGAPGQQVKEQVQDCKQGAASNGKNGIGDCVSDVAQQHGNQHQH
jgi:hypothetical protein